MIRSFAPTAPKPAILPLLRGAVWTETARSTVTVPPSALHRQLGGTTFPLHETLPSESSLHFAPVAFVIDLIVHPGGGLQVKPFRKPMPLVFRTETR